MGAAIPLGRVCGMTRYAEKNTAITGIGMSEVSRGATKSALALTVDAAMEAIADAGLTRAEIDGIATWPGERPDGSGFSAVGCAALQDALRLKVGWYAGGGEAPGQYGAVFTPTARCTRPAPSCGGVVGKGRLREVPGSAQPRPPAGPWPERCCWCAISSPANPLPARPRPRWSRLRWRWSGADASAPRHPPRRPPRSDRPPSGRT